AEGAFQPHPLTHGAAGWRKRVHDDGWRGGTGQLRGGRVRPHDPRPGGAQGEGTSRANRPLKHVLANKVAHVERGAAMVFDGAVAFCFGLEKAFRQSLAGKGSLPPRFGLGSRFPFFTPHALKSMVDLNEAAIADLDLGVSVALCVSGGPKLLGF